MGTIAAETHKQKRLLRGPMERGSIINNHAVTKTAQSGDIV